jgi:ABC-type phosphate/phosphonate transport system substrate-binding protein
MIPYRFFALCFAVVTAIPYQDLRAESGSFTLIVMDPLAAPLSCPCVEGYAQRKYEALADHLKEQLHRDVSLVFGQSLQVAMKESHGQADLIIGKDSVVRADAAHVKLDVKPLAQLTDKKGDTTQYGLIVVNKADPAQKVSELIDYKIIFGPAEAAEKHGAAINLLKAAKVAIPEKLTIDEACSDGACKVIELGPKSKSAAVISSYAQPLLEGCGTVKKGDLRVVGQTDAVPFVSAFVASKLSEAEQVAIMTSLESLKESPEKLDALESLLGFLPYDDTTATKKK